MELGFIAGGAPLGMVAVLFSAAGVFAGGLNVSLAGGADPDVGPGGRDGEGADAAEGGGVADRLAGGGEVAEVFQRVARRGASPGRYP